MKTHFSFIFAFINRMNLALQWNTNPSDLNFLRSELLLWIECKKNVCISFIKSGFFYYLCCLNLFSSQKSCPFQVFDWCKRKIWRHIFLLYPKLKLDLIMPRCFYVLIWSPYSPRRRLLSVSTIINMSRAWNKFFLPMSAPTQALAVLRSYDNQNLQLVIF